MPKFHNPYNFVKTPDRTEKAGFAGDYDPSQPEYEENFSRYWPKRYTGNIPVKLRTATPLFITEPNTKREAADVDGHYIYDCVSEIPATALKGMLSSAYEIITNSRYRVFSENQHSKRLGFRYNANAALVPGRISFKEGRFFVTLFKGTADDSLYAAWLPAYRGGRKVIPDDIQNGIFVQNVELGLYSYAKRFNLWSVERIGDIQFQPISKNIITPCVKKINVNGYVVISGKTIRNKHDERFFFNESGTKPVVLPIPDKIKERYEDLIADYQRNHAIINGRELNPPNDFGIILGEHIEDASRLNLRDGDFVYVKMNGADVEALYPVQISRELSELPVWQCLDESLKPASDISKLSPADRLFGWINQKGTGAWKGKIQISSGKYKPTDENAEPVEKFETPLTLSILGEPKPSQARFYLGKEDGDPQNNGISKERASYRNNKRIRGRKVYLHHSLHFLHKDDRAVYWKPFENDSLTREYKHSDEPSNQNRSITGWIPVRREFEFNVRVENLTSEELGALLTLFSNMEQSCFRIGYGKPLGLGSVRLSINGDIAIADGCQLAERYKNLSANYKYTLRDYERDRCIKAYQKAMAMAYGTDPSAATEEPNLFAFDQEIYGLLDDKEKEELNEVWLSAMEVGKKNAPVDELPEKDILLEFFPADYFEGIYQASLKDYKKYKSNDFGWKNLPFIKDFKAAMTMNDCDARITYPFSNAGPEGFQWFTDNEKMESGHCVYGYSLPPIGKTLEVL